MHGPLDLNRLHQELASASRIGGCIEYLPSTTSTCDEAWQRINDEMGDGLVVLTEHQSAGRGRLGRSWHSPRGASLLCSVALIDRHRDLDGASLGLIAAVAAAAAIRNCCAIQVTIQWPNDLTIRGRKVGGVLIESRLGSDDVPLFVIGMGINCLHTRGHFPPELADRATSLDMEAIGPIDRTALAVALCRELDRWLADPNAWTYEDLRTHWLHAAEPVGRKVQLQHAGRTYTGSVIDIDPRAALVVRLDDGGIRAFHAAVTTLVKEQSVSAPAAEFDYA